MLQVESLHTFVWHLLLYVDVEPTLEFKITWGVLFSLPVLMALVVGYFPEPGITIYWMDEVGILHFLSFVFARFFFSQLPCHF